MLGNMNNNMWDERNISFMRFVHKMDLVIDEYSVSVFGILSKMCKYCQHDGCEVTKLHKVQQI